MKIWIVCAHCGTDEVMRDAWAVWDVEAQEWVLGQVFDAAFCEKCEGDASLEEVPL